MSESSITQYKKEVFKIPRLTPEEIIELGKKAKSGDEEAKKKFIEANLRLVFFVAKKYLNRGLEFEDLIGYGNYGLLKAVEEYKPELGKFGQHAVFYIERIIYRAIDEKARAIRIPSNTCIAIRKMRNVINRLRVSSGHEPTDEELAKELEMSVSKIRWLKNEPLGSNGPLSEGGSEEDFTLASTIEDESVLTPESAIFQEFLSEQMVEVIKGLKKVSERDKEIFFMIKGLNGKNECTRQEVSEKFNITVERVRQIIERIERALLTSRKFQELAKASGFRKYDRMQEAARKREFAKLIEKSISKSASRKLPAEILLRKLGYLNGGSDEQLSKMLSISPEEVELSYQNALRIVATCKERHRIFELEPRLVSLVQNIGEETKTFK